MSTLFRNDSPGALTLEEAIELEQRRAEHRRMAKRLAAEGRGNDTEVAHLAPGEVIVPMALQTPKVMLAIQRAAVEHNISLEMLRVGSDENRVNPRTGAPEFGVMDRVPGLFGNGAGQEGGSQQPPPPANIPKPRRRWTSAKDSSSAHLRVKQKTF